MKGERERYGKARKCLLICIKLQQSYSYTAKSIVSKIKYESTYKLILRRKDRSIVENEWK